MPELPEVETVRRGVDELYTGRIIEEVEATGVRSLRRHPDRAGFAARVQGRRLTGTDRRGKYLILRLDGEDAVVVHLGMSGQLLRAGAGDAPVRHTHVLLRFAGGTELRFVDPRTFGEVFVTATGPGGRIDALAHLGFDPVADPMTARRLAGLLARRRTRLKVLLMDQRFVAGIGNMYADEILHAARLRGDRPAAALSEAEVGRLWRAIRATLRAAVEHRGSSLADEQYRDLYGRVGGYQFLHRAYGREGQPCPRCGTPIVRVRANGRSSFFCPRCQP